MGDGLTPGDAPGAGEERVPGEALGTGLGAGLGEGEGLGTVPIQRIATASPLSSAARS